MKTIYYPKGVCTKQFEIELEDNVIKFFDSDGGCAGNLAGIKALVTGKRADEVIPLFKGIKCGKRSTSCPDQIAAALEKLVALENEEKALASQKLYSAKTIHVDQEYVFSAYPALQQEFSAEEVVIAPVIFDELNYLLHAEGNHMVLFGGPWCEKMQEVIVQVNRLARKYGVGTVYTFDFRADSMGPETTFKCDLTEQSSYDGPGKREAMPLANCNFMYGELVSHHLKNLNSFVRGKIGSGDDITYLNVYQDAVTVPNLHEPFLCLVNNETGIIGAAELDNVPAEQVEAVLEQQVFCHVAEHLITPYTHADYMFDAFKRNERGHAFKTEDAFRKDEQINIRPVTFPEMRWLMNQRGAFLFVFGGPWCAASQSAMATINDFAVANGVQVFMFDSRLDGKHPIDFWKYPRGNELTLGNKVLRKYYIEIWEKYLPGAPIMCSIDNEAPVWAQKLTVDYTDENGVEHKVLGVGVPYIFAYNKANKTREGRRRPLLESVHDAGELINCSHAFIYHDPNYRRFKGGVYSVFWAWAHSAGEEMHDITIDRTAPIVPGELVRHKPTVKYTKKHDWWKERAGDAAPEATVTLEANDRCC